MEFFRTTRVFYTGLVVVVTHATVPFVVDGYFDEPIGHVSRVGILRMLDTFQFTKSTALIVQRHLLDFLLVHVGTPSVALAGLRPCQQVSSPLVRTAFSAHLPGTC